jgi:hypothetical protein
MPKLARRSLRKNRWAAEINIDLEPLNGGTLAVTRVDMLGNKHYALLSEIVENAGDDLFEDQGVTDAVERLGWGACSDGRRCGTSITCCARPNA